MAPVCSNCGGVEFVWASEVKTGSTGGGLSLRPKGEVPIGTRICKSCGHADLFLHDLDLLRKPHLWMPGEFYPISGQKPAPSAPATAPAAPAPPPAPPAPSSPPAPMPPPSLAPAPPPMMPAAPPPSPAPPETAAPGPAPPAPSTPSPAGENAATDAPAKGRGGRRRPKAASDAPGTSSSD